MWVGERKRLGERKRDKRGREKEKLQGLCRGQQWVTKKEKEGSGVRLSQFF